MKIAITILLGAFFGAVLIAARAFHWERIYAMFHFESFYMYGLLFSAIFTGWISVQVLRLFKTKALDGSLIKPKPKPLNPIGNIVGGTIFGIGWGITGACTAPAFILIGWEPWIGLASVAGILVGTLLFALLRKYLPE